MVTGTEACRYCGTVTKEYRTYKQDIWENEFSLIRTDTVRVFRLTPSAHNDNLCRDCFERNAFD